MLSHHNCSSKTEESNKTCLQIVKHPRKLLQTGPNLMLKVTADPFGAGTPSLTPSCPPVSGQGRRCHWLSCALEGLP